MKYTHSDNDYVSYMYVPHGCLALEFESVHLAEVTALLAERCISYIATSINCAYEIIITMEPDQCVVFGLSVQREALSCARTSSPCLLSMVPATQYRSNTLHTKPVYNVL